MIVQSLFKQFGGPSYGSYGITAPPLFFCRLVQKFRSWADRPRLKRSSLSRSEPERKARQGYARNLQLGLG